MPVHRIPTGPSEHVDTLETAVEQLERKGEEVVQVLSQWATYPVGEWVVLTRRVERRPGATRPVERRSPRRTDTAEGSSPAGAAETR